MIEAALVGILQGFSDLPHQCQAHADIELIAALAQEEIEAHGLGVMFEDQCWATLVLSEGLGLENASMIQPLQQQKLTFCCLPMHRSYGLAGM